jgi:hypothetical protein
MAMEDSATGPRFVAGDAAEAEKAEERRANWHDGGSVRGGFMTGKKGYGDDGMADVSISSRYSDKEHLHSFRTDVGAGVHASACRGVMIAHVSC